jgi:spore germination cell wall hydrolase CwlJ-like protein
MIPNPDLPFEKQSTDVLLAMCLWGEARGSSILGMAAVASVILNRMKKRGKSAAEIILAPKQFSSFNADDPNSKKLAFPLAHDTAGAWERCYTVAHLSVNGALMDTTGGADHYYAAVMPKPPYWATETSGWKETTRIGGHIFGTAP